MRGNPWVAKGSAIPEINMPIFVQQSTTINFLLRQERKKYLKKFIMTNGEVSGMKGSYHFFEFLKSLSKNAQERCYEGEVEENNSVEILFTVEFLSSFFYQRSRNIFFMPHSYFLDFMAGILDVLLEKMLRECRRVKSYLECHVKLTQIWQKEIY